MKSFNRFNSFIAFCLLWAVIPTVFSAVNPDREPYPKCKKCKKCDEETAEIIEFTIAEGDCPEPGSLSWAMKIGHARHAKMDSLLDFSRVGPVEGVFRGKMRTFEEIYNDFFNAGPINRKGVFLELDVAEINGALYNPSVLEINGSGIVEKILENDAIRQVKTDNAFTDITLLSSPNVGFKISIWNLDGLDLPKVGDLYTAPNYPTVPSDPQPIMEVIFQKPSTLGANEDHEFMMIKTERLGASGEHVTTDHYSRTVDINTGKTTNLKMTTHAGNGTGGTVISKQQLIYHNRGALKWDYDIERIYSEAHTDANGQMSGLTEVSRTYEVYRDYSVVIDKNTQPETYEGPPNLPNGGVWDTEGGEYQGEGEEVDLVDFLSSFNGGVGAPEIPAPEPAFEGGFVGARRLISITKDYGPGRENLKTSYAYHFDKKNPYVHGRLKSVIRPDLSWELYHYNDGAGSPVSVTTKYSSFKDIPISNYTTARKEVTFISANKLNHTVRVNGQKISQRILELSKDGAGEYTATEKVAAGDGSFATTTSKFHADSAEDLLAGRPKWIKLPSGHISLYSYEQNGEDLQITKQTGLGDENGVTDGIKRVRTHNVVFQMIDERQYDLPSELAIGSRTATVDRDNQSRPTRWFYNDNPADYQVQQRGCCGLEYSRDRSGATSNYYRDALKRVYKVGSQRSSTGPIVTTTTTHTGLTTRTERASSATPSPILVNETTVNISGLTRTVLSPDADGDDAPETTTRVKVFNPGGGTTTTTTYPDLTTTVSTAFIDGGAKSTQDQEGNITTYDRATHNLQGGGMMSQVTKPGISEWVKSYSDQLGRGFRTEYPDGAYSERTYYSYDAAVGSRGRLETSLDPDEANSAGSGSHVSYAYSANGDTTTTTQKLSGNQTRVTVSESSVVASATIRGVAFAPAFRSATTVNGVTTSETYRSINGRTSGSISFGRESLSQSNLPDDGSWEAVSTSAAGVQSKAFYADGLQVATVVFESGATLPAAAPADITAVADAGFVSGSSATYDALGRAMTQTASRTGTATMGTYLENGALTSVTDPSNRVTSFTYDVMGRQIEFDAPDTLDAAGNTMSNITYTSYTDRGLVKASWGDQTYARFYSHNAQGRINELRTYQSLAHGTEPTVDTPGAAVTSWTYDPQRGWLTEKNFDGESNNGPGGAADYTYTLSGHLATRTWERGVVTTYGYDQGQLTSVTYTGETNGHNAPDLTYTYDNFGRLDTVKRDGVLHADYGYHATNLVLLTEQVNQDTGNPQTLTRTYQDGTNGTVNLRSNGYTFTHGSAVWVYDNAGRVSSVSDGTDTFTYGYHYSVNAGGNHVGGVTSGPQSWMPFSLDGPKVDTALEYEASRKSLVSRFNTVGVNPALSSFTYSVDALGQRTSITPGGTAFDTTTALTWGYNAKGELIEADRGAGSAFNRSYLYDGIGNRTSSTDNVVTTAYTANALNRYTAIASLSPSYDLDGNMDSGPVPAAPASNANLKWDAENRLVQATVGSTTTNYDYDYRSRLIKTTTGSTVLHYLYDGWNRIAEYSGIASPTHLRTNFWGLDLSGGLQGAGGVGGLLSIVETGGTVRYYPAYDGNGNVSEYVNQLGAEVAHFEYDPFGNLTVDDQGNAASFPFRFSTKPQDATTGLYYYGYRYYDPVTGRWPSRDPIEERGGFNLYGMVGNNAINKFDLIGLREYLSCKKTGGWRIKKDRPYQGEMMDFIFGEQKIRSFKYQCHCQEHCCWERSFSSYVETGFVWIFQWQERPYYYDTFEEDLATNKNIAAVLGVGYDELGDGLGVVLGPEKFPAKEQVNPSAKTLEERQKELDRLKKAREIWNKQRKKLEEELVNRCRKTCERKGYYSLDNTWPKSWKGIFDGEVLEEGMYIGSNVTDGGRVILPEDLYSDGRVRREIIHEESGRK